MKTSHRNRPRRSRRLLLLLAMAGCSSFDSDPLETFQAFGPPPEDPSPSALFDPFASAGATGLNGADADVYEIGSGDELYIDVWGHPELSGEQTVGPDGRITIPTVGTLSCTGLSRDEAADTIANALKPYYRSLAVTVRVQSYKSNRVSVLGGVKTPGTFQFDGVPTLLGALSQAGGLVELAPGTVPTRCSIVRGHSQIVWLDLGQLLWHGTTSLNVRLRTDDVVYVQDSSDVLVYVLGEVEQPGVYRMVPGMSLLDALALAGGTTDDAQEEEVRLLRPAQGRQVELDFEELMAGDHGFNVPLAQGDIVYVPTSGLGKFGYVMRQISPFAFLFVAAGN